MRVQVLVQHESDMKERIARHLDEVADEQEVESEYRYDANMNTDTFFKRYVFKEDAQRARDHLKEKHRDIAKIEKDLVELNGIMQDIGQLVEYHNELLDQIEMNVEEGKAKVNLGTNTNPRSSSCVADADDLLLLIGAQLPRSWQRRG